MTTTQSNHRLSHAFQPVQTQYADSSRQTQSHRLDDQIALEHSGDVNKELPLEQSYPTHDQIALCAYAIYVANGRAEGRNEQNWRQAEEQLTGVSGASSLDTESRFQA